MRLFFCEMSEGEHSAASETPILDSGVLPDRVRRKTRIGTVVGFLSGVVVGLSIVTVVGEQASRDSNLAVEILLFFAAFCFAILIHELGHLTAGWFLGFRFSRISVGPIELRLEHGKLKVSFLRELIALGFAGMHVDTVIRLRRRFLYFAAAGIAANLITIPIVAWFANHATFAEKHPLSVSFSAQLTMISILMSAVNLLPLPLGAIGISDGYRIAILLKDRPRTHRLLSMMAVHAQQQKGIRAKGWRQTWLKAASSVPDDWIDDFGGNWLSYISASAREDGQQAASHLERCLTLSRSLTNTIRDLAAQEAAIFSAWFRSDPCLADKWLTQITRPALMQPLNRYRVQVATRCARGEFEDSLASLDEGLSCIKLLPETPTKQTLIAGWQEWREQVEGRQRRQSVAEVTE